MHSGKSSTGTDTRPPIRKYLIGASVTSACMVPIALSMQHVARDLAVLTALWVAQVASILAADYLQWRRGQRAIRRAMATILTRVVDYDGAYTWDSPLVDRWSAYLDKLEVLAARPRWNPFRDTDRSGPYIPEGTYR